MGHVAALLALIIVGGDSAAQTGPGDLLVAPTRIVFEGRQRSAELTLVNTGAKAAIYRVSFVQMRMLPDGTLKETGSPEGGAPFADTLVRFAPRQVRLEPRVAQTVRLQVRKPADLPGGEYRSHLRIRAIPEVESSPSGQDSFSQESGIRIDLRPIYGVAIPVIVRQGATWAKAGVTDIGLLPGEPGGAPRLALTLHRSGTRSLYGNVRVSFDPAQGRPRTIGGADGVGVYLPLDARRVVLPLRIDAGERLVGGRFHVTYTQREPGALLAEALVDVP